MVWSHGAVSVEFRDVPRRHCFQCYSLYFHTLLAKYTVQSNANLNNLFYMNIKVNKLLSEDDNILQKMERLT